MLRRAALLVLAGCFTNVAPRAPMGDLPEAGAFPHALFGEVLAARVDGQGRVDYAGLRDDRAALDRYTALLAAASPHSHPGLFPTRDDALAYWLNAYNALAITGVVDRPGLVSVGNRRVRFFYGTRYRLGGRWVSLYTLENGIVREDFDDPRIHFALNCQSAGCPLLPKVPFSAATLDAQLEAGTRAFVADPANVRVDGDRVVLSEIFSWYAEDFPEGPVAFVNAHGASVPAGATVDFRPYDWTLIAQPGRG